MIIESLPYAFSICKLENDTTPTVFPDFFFLAKTNEEVSLVCRTEEAPKSTTAREDGWRGFRIAGVLDFSLIGILAQITAALAEAKIGLFAVSTYNTDYVFVRARDLQPALAALKEKGFDLG